MLKDKGRVIFAPGEAFHIDVAAGTSGCPEPRCVQFTARVFGTLDLPLELCELLKSPLFRVEVFLLRTPGGIH